MKPWCDRPICTRQYSHQHPEAPDTPPGAAEPSEEPVPVAVAHANGSGAQEPSVEEAGRAQVQRARTMRSAKPDDDARPEATNGRHPAPSDPPSEPEVVATEASEWARVTEELQQAEAAVEAARAMRRQLLEDWHAGGKTYEQIAELTGLSRQRISQIVKKP